MSYRFFGNIVNGEVTLSRDGLFHISKVLRLKKGEIFEIVANGECYNYVVVSSNPFTYDFVNKSALKTPKKPWITLLYGLPKGDKLELVIQKAVELGVDEIILVNTQNEVVHFKADKVEAKLERLKKIALSAAMQSKRDFVPEIRGPLSYKAMLQQDYSLKLMAYEKGHVPLASYMRNLNAHESVSILIGAEGGFTTEEVDLASKAGYRIISFGENILRSETATFYALSILSYFKEGV